ncbi:hypothetical protein Y032_0004g1800 [Ancylostoma ceylanicum]|uniref:Uncharacterized protein n=1 Tax=Ancylostoma ceylanicum TaxID=53326 RepID=A0A016VUW2_9BILA|nr:hypothetical protein Y032_0004g1800 [Ancylostoma ceylanicum]
MMKDMASHNQSLMQLTIRRARLRSRSARLCTVPVKKIDKLRVQLFSVAAGPTRPSHLEHALSASIAQVPPRWCGHASIFLRFQNESYVSRRLLTFIDEAIELFWVTTKCHLIFPAQIELPKFCS